MDWEVIASLETNEPQKLEGLSHKAFPEARISPKREFFRLTPEQEELFIRLAEDQRWIREKSHKAGMEATRDLLPDWSQLLEGIPAEEDFITSLTVPFGKPYYSPQRHTVTLWFPAEYRSIAESVAEPNEIERLRSVLRDAWGKAPTIEIRVEDNPDVLIVGEEDGVL